jgi:hypothetical protein
MAMFFLNFLSWFIVESFWDNTIDGYQLLGCKQNILYILITFFSFENMKKIVFQTSNLPLAFQNQ